MFNYYKMMFIMIMMSSTMVSISSSSWMGAWMGLEINLISFIPLISDKNNVFSAEASMKYFIVQALASTAFLFSILTMNKFSWMNESAKLIMNSSLLMKMGSAPFHFWFPEILSKINWNQTIIILTWQKIAPMMLLSYSIKSNKLMLISIILCAMIGSMVGLNQVNLQKIIAYSSINHMGWMLTSMMIMENIWMMYFLIYCTISISLILVLKKFNLFNIKQMFFSLNKFPIMKFIVLINFLSLGGLPPFLGFLPKWLIIQNMIQENMYLMTITLIMFALISLFFYLRVSFSTLMMSYNENTFSLKKMKSNKLIYFLSSISLTGLMLSNSIINMI